MTNESSLPTNVGSNDGLGLRPIATVVETWKNGPYGRTDHAKRLNWTKPTSWEELADGAGLYVLTGAQAAALGADVVTPFGKTISGHLGEALTWMETRRDRLHHEGCSVHEPSASCSCGLHKALTDLRAARNALEEKA